MENTEKKLTVTLDRTNGSQRVYDDLEGVILLLKEKDGVTRVICGDLSIMDLLFNEGPDSILFLKRL